MKTLPAILLLLAALAGCSGDDAKTEEAQTGPGIDAGDVLGTGSGDEHTPPGPNVTMERPEDTVEASVTLRGTVEWSTNLTVRVIGREGPRSEHELAADGAWSLEVPLGLGNNRIVAVSLEHTAAAVEVARLAEATVEILYTAYPAHEDTADTVRFNVDARPTAGDYDGRDIAHPDSFTVHDLLATFTEQTGIAVDYDYSDGLGYAPIRFDGIGQPLTSDAPPWWCYKVNGETAGLGASITQVLPGDVVTWEYAGCA